MKNLAAHLSGYFQTATAPMLLRSKSWKAFPRRPKVIFVILLSVSLSLLLQSLSCYAQAPQQFSFQGVARGADGKIVTNKNIIVGFIIHQGTSNGPQVFNEVHNTTTNVNGVFNLQIGSITNLSNLNWEANSYFLHTIMYYDGLPAQVDLGSTQLLSVPYSISALKSIKSEKADTAFVAKKWVDDAPIIQTGSDNTSSLLPDISIGNMLIWYPKKGAFRAGNNDGNWTRATIGKYSFAAGDGTLASGESSTSFGLKTKASDYGTFAAGSHAEANAPGAIVLGTNSIASGENSTSLGSYAHAIGDHSIALGYGAEASGNASIALGNSTVIGERSISLGEGIEVKAVDAIAIGKFNNNSDSPGINPTTSDRIFQLGNGTTNAARSNAITVLRNGNVGIGNNVLQPEFLLDLGGRIRINHNGETAGIHFDNSIHNPDGFVGMKTDNEVGLYVNDGWRFWVNSSNAFVNGNVVNTSDSRLKKMITPVAKSLLSLTSLKGYHYYWKDEKQGGELQTGLIAQNVEQIFPELVITNKDGYKSVNYIGLIPHLIEAVKELDQRTAEVAELKKELAQARELNKRISQLEAGLKSLLDGNTSATGNTQSK
jgi:hypothetical protein